MHYPEQLRSCCRALVPIYCVIDILSATKWWWRWYSLSLQTLSVSLPCRRHGRATAMYGAECARSWRLWTHHCTCSDAIAGCIAATAARQPVFLWPTYPFCAWNNSAPGSKPCCCYCCYWRRRWDAGWLDGGPTPRNAESCWYGWVSRQRYTQVGEMERTRNWAIVCTVPPAAIAVAVSAETQQQQRRRRQHLFYRLIVVMSEGCSANQHN